MGNRVYTPCMCCNKDSEYRHWDELLDQYDWFCEEDKCSDCEFIGWTPL